MTQLFLDHQLQLKDQIIAITQEPDAVKLAIDVVVLHGETEGVASERDAWLDDPGALPVIKERESRRNHSGTIGSRDEQGVDNLIRIYIDVYLVVAMRVADGHGEMSEAKLGSHLSDLRVIKIEDMGAKGLRANQERLRRVKETKVTVNIDADRPTHHIRTVDIILI